MADKRTGAAAKRLSRASNADNGNPRKGWDEAFAAADPELDREWLEADLARDDDWTWDGESAA